MLDEVTCPVSRDMIAIAPPEFLPCRLTFKLVVVNKPVPMYTFIYALHCIQRSPVRETQHALAQDAHGYTPHRARMGATFDLDGRRQAFLRPFFGREYVV